MEYRALCKLCSGLVALVDDAFVVEALLDDLAVLPGLHGITSTMALATPPRRTQTEMAGAGPAPSAPVAAPSNSSSGAVAEGALMSLLRSARDHDPALAIALAREGNRRFPGSADAPERASILIHALAKQGFSSEARGEAEEMVNRYPDSAWVHEIEQFTGARRHRNIRVGSNGELHYVESAPPI